MINFLLAPACYCLVIQVCRLWGIFRRASKALLVFISMLIYGCLLNFVHEPPDMIACGGLLSWTAICVTEFFIHLENIRRG